MFRSFLLGATLLALASPASAAVVADAANWPSSTDGTNAISSTIFHVDRSIYETFTVLNSGKLVELDLNGFVSSDFLDQPWQEHLTILGGGTVTSVGTTVLGEVSRTAVEGIAVQSFDFSASNILVNVGQVLTFEMSVDPCNVANCNHDWVDYRKAGYAGGSEFESSAGSIFPVANNDLAFRTYVDTSFTAPGVPEPAAWSLMILGFAGAGGLLRRRRGLPGLAR